MVQFTLLISLEIVLLNLETFFSQSASKRSKQDCEIPSNEPDSVTDSHFWYFPHLNWESCAPFPPFLEISFLNLFFSFFRLPMFMMKRSQTRIQTVYPQILSISWYCSPPSSILSSSFDSFLINLSFCSAQRNQAMQDDFPEPQLSNGRVNGGHHDRVPKTFSSFGLVFSIHFQFSFFPSGAKKFTSRSHAPSRITSYWWTIAFVSERGALDVLNFFSFLSFSFFLKNSPLFSKIVLTLFGFSTFSIDYVNDPSRKEWEPFVISYFLHHFHF